MSSAGRYTCEHCGRKGFKSETSLHQHQTQNDVCFEKLTSDLGSQYSSGHAKNEYKGAASKLTFGSVNPHVRPSLFDDLLRKPKKHARMHPNISKNTTKPSYGQPLQYEDFGNDFGMPQADIDDDEPQDVPNLGAIDDSMRQNFHDYVQRSQEFIPFTHLETTAITLLIQ